MRPVSVGIFGTWGTGKSTLLNLIEEELCPGGNDESDESNVIVIRFDAWLYQGYDDARAALMEAIGRRLLKVAGANKGLAKRALSLLKRIDKLRLLGMAFDVGAAAFGFPTFGIGAKALGAAGHFLAGSHDESDEKAIVAGVASTKKLIKPAETHTPPEEIDAFREELGKLLVDLGKIVVVFVDNLDRCLPAQTIQTLEALRLFLFMDETAFVVAADEDMVRYAVKQHYKGGGKNYVNDYLDKLIQVPVRVPRLGVQEVRAYLFMLFAAASDIEATRVDALRDGLEENLRESWNIPPLSPDQAACLLGVADGDPLRESLHLASRMADLLTHSGQINGNPRIIKRLLNVVRMRAGIARRRKMPVDEAMIAKMAIAERSMDPDGVIYLYSEINAAASGKPLLLGQLEALIEDPEKFAAACPEPLRLSSDFLREWLTLKPPMADVDLRPLVYLSRETTALRTYSGLLSAAATDAVGVLQRATFKGSPSAAASIARIPPGEPAEVMREIVAGLRQIPDWTARPAGFVGATMLAESSTEAAAVLVAFLRERNSNEPWIKMVTDKASWFPKENE